jgi:hypothetical protein
MLAGIFTRVRFPVEMPRSLFFAIGGELKAFHQAVRPGAGAGDTLAGACSCGPVAGKYSPCFSPERSALWVGRVRLEPVACFSPVAVAAPPDASMGAPAAGHEHSPRTGGHFSAAQLAQHLRVAPPPGALQDAFRADLLVVAQCVERFFAAT